MYICRMPYAYSLGAFYEKRKKSSQDQGDEDGEETGNHASKAWRWQE